MSNKLLKRAISRAEKLPPKEFEKLIKRQIAEADMFEAILNQTPLGHILLKDKKVRFCNNAFRRLIPTNRHLKLFEGKSLKDLVLDYEVLSYLEGLNEKNLDDEKEFYFQNGSAIKIVKITHRLIETEEDVYIDINVRDITDEKIKETRLRRSESLASMTTMAAGIAHEIKNPLAAMQIHLQLLRKAFTKNQSLSLDKADRYLSVLEEEIDRLNRIAVDFLFAVRPMNIELKLQNIEPFLSSLYEFIKPEVESHNIKLEWNISSYLPKLEIDKNYFNQCLLNIINNAIGAIGENGLISFTTKQDGDFVSFVVKDNGKGISEENLSKIFEPYFTTKATGTGLGLTVVYKIVRNHKGDISVESQEGIGTEFKIKLPIPNSQRAQLTDEIEV